jgi:E3 ubiquitin-protein ligase UHRF1
MSETNPIQDGRTTKVNTSLVVALCMARIKKNPNSVVSTNANHYIINDKRSEKAFTTDRAKRTCKANASSGYDVQRDSV